MTRGWSSTLVEHCVQRHTLVSSDFILNELRKHLVQTFKYSVAGAEEVVSLFRSKMEVVRPTDLGTAVCRDPDDDAILGTAVAGNAVCIVTGDKDLLVLKRFRSIDIIHPSEFAEYEARSS